MASSLSGIDYSAFAPRINPESPLSYFQQGQQIGQDLVEQYSRAQITEANLEKQRHQNKMDALLGPYQVQAAQRQDEMDQLLGPAKAQQALLAYKRAQSPFFYDGMDSDSNSDASFTAPAASNQTSTDELPTNPSAPTGGNLFPASASVGQGVITTSTPGTLASIGQNIPTLPPGGVIGDSGTKGNGTLALKATGYHPVDSSDPDYKMEGGHLAGGGVPGSTSSLAGLLERKASGSNPAMLRDFNHASGSKLLASDAETGEAKTAVPPSASSAWDGPDR